MEDIQDNSDDEDAYTDSTDNSDDNDDDGGHIYDEDTVPDPLDLPFGGMFVEPQHDENNEGIDENNNDHDYQDDNENEEEGVIAPENYEHEENESNEDDETAGVGDDQTVNEGEETNKQQLLEQEMDEKYGARNHSIGLRPRRKPKHVKQKEAPLATKPSDYDRAHANLQHTALTQYSIKKGLKFSASLMPMP